MNPALERLQAYPFERLARLLAAHAPPADLRHIGMSIGEPRHPPPELALAALRAHLDELGSYPATRGLPALRAALAQALTRRCLPGGGALDPDSMVLPVNGTREALFAFVQAVVDPARHALVAMPNPGYQIYEGAALLAGAEPCYLDTTAATRFLPDLDAVPAAVWDRCQLLFLCSPGNPTGAVLSLEYLHHALELAERHDFVIAADECYADLYLDSAPPPSLLQAAHQSGRSQFERCMVFHSLSKRSSLPGLRSGVVAGDPRLLGRFLLYRTYHGCAMPIPTQLASIAAWGDEAHVALNRDRYREKFARVLPILQPALDVARPDGAFYLWPAVPGDDVEFARALHQHQNLTILPGSFMARAGAAGNPGRGRVRISLVAGVEECVEAAQRIRRFVTGN
ncbi:MAG: succinyldiaminopimelate transaminase [Gammaproteobacteria bacterium]|nr:succinyldiaminopimelate transaminase [Gammaproteobacteria bacterium]